MPAQALTNQIRDLLIEEINQLHLLGQLSILAEAGQNSDDLNLYHSMDQLYLGNAQVATSLAHVEVLEYQDNLVRSLHAYGDTRPYGVSWGPTESGLYVVHASAVDQVSGNRVMSDPIVLTSTTGVGRCPRWNSTP